MGCPHNFDHILYITFSSSCYPNHSVRPSALCMEQSHPRIDHLHQDRNVSLAPLILLLFLIVQVNPYHNSLSFSTLKLNLEIHKPDNLINIVKICLNVYWTAHLTSNYKTINYFKGIFNAFISQIKFNDPFLSMNNISN